MKFLSKQTHSYTFTLMIACLLLGWIGLSNQASAQVLDANSRVGIVLDDGTQVILYAKASTINRDRKPGSKADDYYNEENSGQYYYLPTNLRLSAREDGTPEFLFLKYTTDEKATAGGVQGALMHFLMEWGLTPAQEDELQKKLVQKLNEIKGNGGRRGGGRFGAGRNLITPGFSSPKGGNKMAKVMGPANLRSDTEESFRIISGTLSNKDFTPALVTTGRAPLLPGSKIAVGTILEKNGAQLLAATFEKNRSITDVSINLRFRYDVLMPAVDGRIVVHWERIDSLYQQYKRDYTHHDQDDGTLPKYNSLGDDIITDEIKDSLYVSMTESNAVTIQLDNLQPDNPVAQEVTKAFMDYFLSSITEKEFIQMDAPKAYDPSDGYQPSEDLYEYHMNMEKFETKIARKTETYDLMVRLPITQEFTLTENLASWYDGVKHNEACVSSVNLNDPFFQHRDLNFILDLEAKEMFDQEVNYVTLNVRKKRNDGHDFYDSETIDANYVKSKGIKASMSYARMDDNNSESYEYQTQWSLRGGNVYPANPRWTRGAWEGVTLAPPVQPHTIEFEADLDQMEEMEIVRTTLQVRYMKFGKEVETNIPISGAKGEPLTEKMIFIDRETQGYAYRLIFNHKTEGKLALDWTSKINDDYVYAVIPDELQDKGSQIFNRAVEAAKTIIRPEKDGTVKPEAKVLDAFKDIFGIIRN